MAADYCIYKSHQAYEIVFLQCQLEQILFEFRFRLCAFILRKGSRELAARRVADTRVCICALVSEVGNASHNKINCQCTHRHSGGGGVCTEREKSINALSQKGSVSIRSVINHIEIRYIYAKQHMLSTASKNQFVRTDIAIKHIGFESAESECSQWGTTATETCTENLCSTALKSKSGSA